MAPPHDSRKDQVCCLNAAVRLSLRKGYAMPLEGRAERYFGYDFDWLERTEK
jgi:hypothetical protein